MLNPMTLRRKMSRVGPAFQASIPALMSLEERMTMIERSQEEEGMGKESSLGNIPLSIQKHHLHLLEGTKNKDNEFDMDAPNGYSDSNSTSIDTGQENDDLMEHMVDSNMLFHNATQARFYGKNDCVPYMTLVNESRKEYHMNANMVKLKTACGLIKPLTETNNPTNRNNLSSNHLLPILVEQNGHAGEDTKQHRGKKRKYNEIAANGEPSGASTCSSSSSNSSLFHTSKRKRGNNSSVPRPQMAPLRMMPQSNHVNNSNDNASVVILSPDPSPAPPVNISLPVKQPTKSSRETKSKRAKKSNTGGKKKTAKGKGKSKKNATKSKGSAKGAKRKAVVKSASDATSNGYGPQAYMNGYQALIQTPQGFAYASPVQLQQALSAGGQLAPYQGVGPDGQRVLMYRYPYYVCAAPATSTDANTSTANAIYYPYIPYYYNYQAQSQCYQRPKRKSDTSQNSGSNSQSVKTSGKKKNASNSTKTANTTQVAQNGYDPNSQYAMWGFDNQALLQYYQVLNSQQYMTGNAAVMASHSTPVASTENDTTQTTSVSNTLNKSENNSSGASLLTPGSNQSIAPQLSFYDPLTGTEIADGSGGYQDIANMSQDSGMNPLESAMFTDPETPTMAESTM